MPRRFAQVLAGALIGLVVALAIVRDRAAARPAPGEEFLLPAPLPAPDFELTSQAGEVVHLRDLAASRTVVLFFGYTNCPDICPLTMAAIGQARERLGKDAERVVGAMVTVDPERDTPEALAKWLERFPAGLMGLTGSEEAIAAAMKGYMVMAEHDEQMGSDPYMIAHSGRIMAVHGGGVPMTFPAEATPEEIATGLTLLLRKG